MYRLIRTVEQYEIENGCRFEPDFSPSERRKLNSLAVIHNLYFEREDRDDKKLEIPADMAWRIIDEK